MTTLDEISYLHPHDITVLSRLQEIVGLALCVRFHQSQDQTVMLQWQNAIKRLKEPTGMTTNTEQPRETWRESQSSTLKQRMRDAQEQMKKFQEILNELEKEAEREREPEGYVREEKYHQEKVSRKAERERERKKKREDEEELRRRHDEEQRAKDRAAQEEATKRKEREAKERERKARQKTEKEREEHEKSERKKREADENNRREQLEWDKVWMRYEAQWKDFKWEQYTGGRLNEIPWPVKSGSHHDVRASSVEKFFNMAVPKDSAVSKKLMRKECLKWHPDKINRSFQGLLPEAERLMVDMILRQVTNVLNEAAGRSSDFIVPN